MTTLYIPDLIGEVVGKVNEVLSKRSEPINVNYDWGHDLEVIKNLTNKDKAPSRPPKYPLVWYVMNFKESMGNVGLYTRLTGARLYIMTSTKINYSMKERRDLKFLPILYPIYSELINQLADSSLFSVSSAQAIEHTKMDMPYWSEDGQKSNFYNDFVDAIQISDLKLDVKKKIC